MKVLFVVPLKNKKMKKLVTFLGIAAFALYGVIMFFCNVIKPNSEPITKEEKKINYDLSLLQDSIYLLNQKLSFFELSLKKDTAMVEPGGSLCRTLGMSEDEALTFAQKFGYHYWYKTSGDLIVNIQPGECFVKGPWQPEVLKHLVKK